MVSGMTPEERLLQAVANPATYWEERASRAESSLRALRALLDPESEAHKAFVQRVGREHRPFHSAYFTVGVDGVEAVLADLRAELAAR